MKRLCAVVGVLAVGFAPGIANGATALIIGGHGQYAHLSDEQMATALGGYFADYERVNVPFPGSPDFGNSIDVGTTNLYDAVRNTPGRKTIAGVSEGAPSVSEVLTRLANDPNPPPAGEVDAVIYGYPSRVFFRSGGIDYVPLPETPYDILVIKAEYDGIADWPDNSFNLLAVANALMGASQLHVPAAFTDIENVPPEYVTTTTNTKGGTTRSVLIPTKVLPLLKPLIDNGSNEQFVDFLDSILRPIVDSAYDRPKGEANTLSRSDTEDSGPAVLLTPVRSTLEALSAKKPRADRADSRGDTVTAADTPRERDRAAGGNRKVKGDSNPTPMGTNDNGDQRTDTPADEDPSPAGDDRHRPTTGATGKDGREPGERPRAERDDERPDPRSSGTRTPRAEFSSRSGELRTR